MRKRDFVTTALFVLLPTAVMAAEESLRGSPASMTRQHSIALEEDLGFNRTPASVLKEVEAGTLTRLDGNADYRTANVSFPYAVPEVRMFVERVAKEYRASCGEQLVVTSLTRPKVKQPRNSHKLSVHPAGIAVDLRISQSAACRSWIERTLLALEADELLDVTRERNPPHYHVAVFPTPYRTYVERADSIRFAAEAATRAATVQPAPVVHSAMSALPSRDASVVSWIAPMIFLAMTGATALGAVRRRARQR